MDQEILNRQQKEKDFHNRKAALGPSQVIYTNRRLPYYDCFYDLIGDVAGLRILDYGCGNGWFSHWMASRGAHVIGIDISDELIKQALLNYADKTYDGSVDFTVMAAENLTFEPESFDLVVGSAILHHTDLKSSVCNIERILKRDGGRAIFVEPMNQNFILRLWRMMTPWRRSPVEKALTWDDICLITDAFPSVKMIFFCFFSILSSGLFLILPNSKLLSYIDIFFNKIDGKILSRWPQMGRYCAVVVLELRKKRNTQASL